MMKRGLILIFVLMLVITFSQNVSAVISCGSQTYPDGTGYCCDTGNGANGVWFRGDYYSSCPNEAGFRYVSNSGLDTNPGTFNSPWRTVNKANNDLFAGDAAIFLGGDYNEQARDISGNLRFCESAEVNLWPARSGTAGNPIIVKGHPDYPRPIIRASGFPGSVVCPGGNCHHRPVCAFPYLTLDYLEITDSAAGIRVDGANNVIFQDLKIHDTDYISDGNNPAGILLGYTVRTLNGIVRGNEIYNIRAAGGCGANCAGVTVYFHDNFTIENNYIHDAASGVSIKGGFNGRVRNNKIYNTGEGIRHNCDYSRGGDGGWGTLGDSGHTNITENIIYNSYSWGVFLHENVQSSCGSGMTAGKGELDDEFIFNNIIYNDQTSGPRNGIMISTNGFNIPMTNINVRNNILVNSTSPTRDENLANLDYTETPGFVSSNNLYYDSTENDVIFWCDEFDGGIGECSIPSDAHYTLAQFKSLYPTLEVNSIQTNPLFLSTNPSSPDFLRPAPGSPAIDNGTIIPGYHCASSGPNSSGCRVWYGSAPDIGAYEYNPGGPAPVTCIQADVNDDLIINIIDLALVIYNQGQPLTGRAHLNVNNQDSVINYQDVQEVLNRVGQSC